MDEYLFFQQHKKQLREQASVLSPRIFGNKTPAGGGNFEFGATATSGFGRTGSRAAFMTSPRQNNSTLDVRKSLELLSQKEEIPVAPVIPILPSTINPLDFELTEETMKESLELLSGNYVEQYTSAGFPPKICTLLMKELSDISKLKCQVLDVGCGKGHVGEYLKNDGYLHITGLDCSKSLLEIAKEKKAYENLVRAAVGESTIDESHNDKYDFVVSATMINNDGWDSKVFLQFLKYVKMGGFVIFATKLNLRQENQYENTIQEICDSHHWKFVTEHTFYRYDKLCGGKGKFSNKMVKVMAMQKTNNEEWEANQIILNNEAMKATQEKAATAAEKKKAVQAKLNAAATAKNERKMLLEKKNSELVLDEELTILSAEEEERKAAERAAKKKENQKAMLSNLRKKIKELMWIKLKENQQKALEELEEKKKIAAQKREQAKLAKLNNFNPAG